MSVPARLEDARAPGARFLRFLFLTAPGRALLDHRFGVRVARDWDIADSPADLVGRIAPLALTIIHGADDYIFEVEQAEELRRLAERAPASRCSRGSAMPSRAVALNSFNM